MLRRLGASVIFVAVLLAYTTQTELAQWVQQRQGYRKPYFLLYLTHSGYMLILPLHLLVFRLMGIPIQPALSTLRAVLCHQFAAPPPTHDTLARPSYLRSLSRSSLPPDVIPAPIERRSSMRRLLGPEERRRGRKEWKWRLAKRVGSLTLLIALPALTWYAAVPLTSMTDITAIYNVFAFWAYLLSIVLLKEEATRLKLGAVLLAVTGVFVIAYGDSLLAPGDPVMELNQGSSRLLGNLLALAGSIFYAFYEVWYKMHVSLPEPRSTDDVEQDPGETESLLSSRASSINGDAESTLHGTSSSTSTIRPPLPYPPSAKGADGSSVSSFLPPAVDPSNTTFLLHSNVITFLIGLSTFCFLWIPIPILHLVGWEHFELPPASTIPAIVGIVLSGVIFNAGFMVLLSLWGPVIASVGNLCTLVLVALADTIISDTDVPSRSTLVGCGMVIAAFAMLVFGTGRTKRETGEASAG